jgi:hypothetical protein
MLLFSPLLKQRLRRAANATDHTPTACRPRARQAKGAAAGPEILAACNQPSGPQLEANMNLKLSLKRPLFYLLIPVLLVLAFVGFPLPIAPGLRTKPKQEQSVPAEEISRKRQNQ